MAVFRQLESIAIAGLTALAVAVAGAVVAGVFAWWLERRRESVEAHAAELLLEQNLADARVAIERALEINWWWPVGEALPTDAWRDYRAALARRFDARTLADVAEIAGRLESTNNWAGIQRDRALKREELIEGWIKDSLSSGRRLSEHDVKQAQATLGLTYEFGKRERAALTVLHDDVASTENGLAPIRRTWIPAVALISMLIAVVGLFFLVRSVSAPDFDEDALASSIREQRPGASLVSCDAVGGRKDSWECTVAYETNQRACGQTGRARQQIAAVETAIVVAQAGSSAPCQLRLAELLRVTKDEKEDCYMALRVGIAPKKPTKRAQDSRARPGPGFEPSPVDGQDDTAAACID